MYASLSGLIFFDISSDSAFATQSTTPRSVIHVSPASTPVVKVKVPLKDKDKDKDRDSVHVFLWTNFLNIGSDTPYFIVNDNPATRASHLGNRAGGGPFQDTNQSADPEFGRHDPARGQFNEQTRTDGGQGYNQDQRHQGRQAANDTAYPAGYREPRQAGYRDQAVGGPQERFEPPVNYGTSTGTGRGARPCDHEIRRDGGFCGKPSVPERMMGKLALFPHSLCGMSLDDRSCLQALQKRWSERLPAMLGCTNMARIARCVNLRV